MTKPLVRQSFIKVQDPERDKQKQAGMVTCRYSPHLGKSREIIVNYY